MGRHSTLLETFLTAAGGMDRSCDPGAHHLWISGISPLCSYRSFTSGKFLELQLAPLRLQTDDHPSHTIGGSMHGT